MKTTAWVTLAATFFLMCVVRMWWTMFLLFGVALALALLVGKNRFCSDLCPMGALQDSMGAGAAHRRRIASARWWKFLLVPLFWGATIYSTFTYHHAPSVLWVWMLRIMISMFFLSMITQMYLGRRFFCVHLCPLRHPVLEPVRRSRNQLMKKRKPA